MARGSKVERPTKKHEYEIRFGSVAAQRGWNDLRATMNSALVDAWDFLTHSPLARTASNYPLRGRLQYLTRDGEKYERWQHKPTAKGDARIWFYVSGRVVHLEDVHTSHPNETK